MKYFLVQIIFKLNFYDSQSLSEDILLKKIKNFFQKKMKNKNPKKSKLEKNEEKKFQKNQNLN